MLFLCTYCSNVDMIKLAVEKGEYLEQINGDNGWRCIHYACCYESKNPDIIKYLIEKGVNLEIPTSDGEYPIHLACRYSTIEIIKLMIDKGVDINVKTNKGLSIFCLLGR